MSSPYQFILDGMEWSYTSVSTYMTCPKSFKMIYLDLWDKETNAFAEWGTLMHSIMERYYTGQADLPQLPGIYLSEYMTAMQHKFPYMGGLGKKYYERGIEYLRQFNGLFDRSQVVGVEETFHFKLEGRPFVGIIDLILKTPEGYVIVDHKSRSAFKSKKEQAVYARQLYLYAAALYQHKGVLPVKMYFHLFKPGADLVEIPFNMDHYHEALNWILQGIEAIYEDREFASCVDLAKRDLDAFEATDFLDPKYEKTLKHLKAEVRGKAFFCDNICSGGINCQESYRYVAR